MIDSTKAASPRTDLVVAFAAFAGGDRAALGRVYDCFAGDMFGLALWLTGSRDDAADAVQEAFVHLARTRAKLEAVRNPRSYLLATVHRAAIDITRRARTVALDVTLLEPVHERHDERLDGARLNRVLAELPAEQREAVYLRHFGELSFAEIGAVAGVSLFTAASRYRLGMRRLRRRLGVES
jgi:RNA polymerase sigma-70 factor (ECF subfamily)